MRDDWNAILDRAMAVRATSIVLCAGIGEARPRRLEVWDESEALIAQAEQARDQARRLVFGLDAPDFACSDGDAAYA